MNRWISRRSRALPEQSGVDSGDRGRTGSGIDFEQRRAVIEDAARMRNERLRLWREEEASRE